ncbi:MAG: outer membrane lipoprotein-sorting protein [Pseudomonadota bacterium]
MMRRKNNLKRGARPATLLIATVLILLLLPLQAFSKPPAQAGETWDGRRIMEEGFKRHELFPYVFEEQTMVLLDGAGNRDVRKMRRFTRVETDGTVKFLLVFDNPAEVRGVALLAVRQRSGTLETGIYLPAFGKEIKSTEGKNRSNPFLGTDFAVEDLTTEALADFNYVRKEDRKLDKIPFFVVEAFPKNAEIEQTTGYSLCRHFIRQDNFFIVRTDYYDPRGRFLKRKTHHDLKSVGDGMWRSNMILMENHKARHSTLIKIDRRVFSRDYVPSEIFTTEWLLSDRHVQDTEKRLYQKASRSSKEIDTKAQKNTH